VAKGITQIEGMDYEKAFSSLLSLAFNSPLLALILHLNLKLFQIDVKTAFPDGNLKEDIHIDQPIGFVSKVKMTRCVVLKCLYMVLSNLLNLGKLDSMKP